MNRDERKKIKKCEKEGDVKNRIGKRVLRCKGKGKGKKSEGDQERRKEDEFMREKRKERK